MPGTKSTSLSWGEMQQSQVTPAQLVQIGSCAFIPPSFQSVSTPCFVQPELDVVTPQPIKPKPKKTRSQRFQLSPNSRVSRSLRIRSQSPPLSPRMESVSTIASKTRSPSPKSESLSLRLQRHRKPNLSTLFRIDGIQSLRSSPTLGRQEPAPSLANARSADSPIKSLSECFIRLQHHPEKMLAFFGSYHLYSSTEDVLTSLLEVTDNALKVADQHEMLLQEEPSQIGNYFDSVAFLNFLPIFLTTWISFDDRLIVFFPRIMEFFNQRKGRGELQSLEKLPELVSTCMEDHGPSKKGSAILYHTNPDETGHFTSRFLSLTPHEAAFCLNAAHLKLLRRVRPWMLIDYALHPGEGSPCAAVPFHFNTVVGWIASICLKRTDFKKRADAITRWIQIARASWEGGYISVLLMITSALNSIPLSRLKHTWAAVNEASIREFTAFSSFCSPIGNYAPLREFVSTHKGVVMPMAITTRDIVMLAEMMDLKSAVQSTDNIPYDVCLTFGNLLSTPPVYHLLQEESDNQLGSIIQFLSNPVPRLSNERLYKISLMREPSNRDSGDPTGSFSRVTSNPLFTAQQIVE